MDYYIKVINMNEEQLHSEIESINKKLFKMKNRSNPMSQQLLGMLDTARSALNDIMAAKRIKKEDTVINIGEIESSVIKQDYSNEELVNILVTEYTKNIKK